MNDVQIVAALNRVADEVLRHTNAANTQAEKVQKAIVDVMHTLHTTNDKIDQGSAGVAMRVSRAADALESIGKSLAVTLVVKEPLLFQGVPVGRERLDVPPTPPEKRTVHDAIAFLYEIGKPELADAIKEHSAKKTDKLCQLADRIAVLEGEARSAQSEIRAQRDTIVDLRGRLKVLAPQPDGKTPGGWKATMRRLVDEQVAAARKPKKKLRRQT